MILTEILKESNYKLTQFKKEQIERLNRRIETKTHRRKPVPFVECLVRKKNVQLKPEETVRQLYLWF